MYSFGKDSISKEKKKSSLDKHDRLELAVKSYIEIFAYSSAVYFSFNPAAASTDTSFEAALPAILTSLGIGTLTNVGDYVSTANGLVSLLPFIQIFTTLSLIILSLAIYASDNKSSSPKEETKDVGL